MVVERAAEHVGAGRARRPGGQEGAVGLRAHGQPLGRHAARRHEALALGPVAPVAARQPQLLEREALIRLHKQTLQLHPGTALRADRCQANWATRYRQLRLLNSFIFNQIIKGSY